MISALLSMLARGIAGKGLSSANLTIRAIVAIKRSLVIDVDSNCSEAIAQTGGAS